MKTKSIAKEGRVVILLQDPAKSTVSKVQKELNIKLTSSAELGSKVRASDIFDSGKGIVFKNLGIAIVDNIEAEHLGKYSTASDSPILHWEPEQEFYPVNNPMNIVNDLKRSTKSIQDQLLNLERLIKIQQEKETIFKGTWGLRALGIDRTKLTGKGVDICILDTGFYGKHPDFTDREIIGKSFINGEAWDFDGNGHGTHCTGTAAGNVSKNEGIRYGVAKNANIKIGKVLADRGSGSTSGIVDAMDWAIEKKYRVISMSLGSPTNQGSRPSLFFERIGIKALENNSLVIAAAGNDSRRPSTIRSVSSPANAESIMAVGAIDDKMKMAHFSNGGINQSTGGKVDLVGPGVQIYSAYSKNAPSSRLHVKLNGTSMATPHISGLAALYMEAFPNLSARAIWTKMEDHAKRIPNLPARDIGKGLGQII